MAFCTHCGAQIPDGAKFCTSCGAPLAAAPAANPAPQAAPAAQPAQPGWSQPRATTTPQGGIVIDAPAGSTVNISDNPPASSGVAAPAEKGEFTLVTWDDEASPTPQQPQYPQQPYQQQPYAQQPYQQPYQQPQYPQQPYQQPYQQPQYPQQPYQQAPQYYQQPQQPQGPMTVKQALNKSKQDIFGKYMPNQAQPAAPAPAPEKKKKRSIWGWIVVILVGLVYLAMKLNW